MQCKKCGSVIREGELACSVCRVQVRMVPDYNPEEEVILHQVREALNEKDAIKRQEPTRAQRNQADRTGDREAQIRRKQEFQRKQLAKKKQQNTLMIMGSFVVLVILVSIYFLYTTSYSGVVAKANKSVVEKQYEEAKNLYEKAIKKDSSRTEAYNGLSNIYLIQDDFENAESVLLNAVESNKYQLDMYNMVIDFYLEEEELTKIMPFLVKCTDNAILKELEEFIVEQPDYSLEEDVFDDVREVSLSSQDDVVYYTIDGSAVTTKSLKYSDPIQLSEGITVVNFIAVNDLGISSIPLKKTYQVELPIEGAPIVSPSTGQYNKHTQITVQVPVGYTAYYTTDGSVPSSESNRYYDSITMPEGNTIFSVILINASGRGSEITKRNYELIIN